jgi:hypothetical protein
MESIAGKLMVLLMVALAVLMAYSVLTPNHLFIG